MPIANAKENLYDFVGRFMICSMLFSFKMMLYILLIVLLGLACYIAFFEEEFVGALLLVIIGSPIALILIKVVDIGGRKVGSSN